MKTFVIGDGRIGTVSRAGVIELSGRDSDVARRMGDLGFIMNDQGFMKSYGEPSQLVAYNTLIQFNVPEFLAGRYSQQFAFDLLTRVGKITHEEIHLWIDMWIPKDERAPEAYEQKAPSEAERNAPLDERESPGEETRSK